MVVFNVAPVQVLELWELWKPPFPTASPAQCLPPLAIYFWFLFSLPFIPHNHPPLFCFAMGMVANLLAIVMSASFFNPSFAFSSHFDPGKLIYFCSFGAKNSQLMMPFFSLVKKTKSSSFPFLLWLWFPLLLHSPPSIAAPEGVWFWSMLFFPLAGT